MFVGLPQVFTIRPYLVVKIVRNFLRIKWTFKSVLNTDADTVLYKVLGVLLNKIAHCTRMHNGVCRRLIHDTLLDLKKSVHNKFATTFCLI